MKATINEISRNAEKARNITHRAVSDALNASHTVDELKKLANDLKEMVEIFIMRHLHRRRI